VIEADPLDRGVQLPPPHLERPALLADRVAIEGRARALPGFRPAREVEPGARLALLGEHALERLDPRVVLRAQVEGLEQPQLVSCVHHVRLTTCGE